MIDPQLAIRAKAVLEEFTADAQAALQDSLRSIILFGSAAEDALRATSDVNVIVVLHRFESERIDALREALIKARVAIRLEVMFLLESELATASEAFAVKFADIQHRRRVLLGDDVFATLTVSPEAMRARLQQVLLNMNLRLRQAFAVSAHREERLPAVLAEQIAPLRTCAAALLDLRGEPAASPKAALEKVVSAWGDAVLLRQLAAFSQIREGELLASGAARQLVLDMLKMVERLAKELAV